jgi:hypothetical protein
VVTDGEGGFRLGPFGAGAVRVVASREDVARPPRQLGASAKDLVVEAREHRRRHADPRARRPAHPRRGGGSAGRAGGRAPSCARRGGAEEAITGSTAGSSSRVRAGPPRSWRGSPAIRRAPSRPRRAATSASSSAPGRCWRGACCARAIGPSPPSRWRCLMPTAADFAERRALQTLRSRASSLRVTRRRVRAARHQPRHLRSRGDRGGRAGHRGAPRADRAGGR